MTKTYLSELNRQQRRAVMHGSKSKKPPRALLIIAGPGSGKTSTIACCAAHRIVRGTDPDRIALLVFARKAAEEMTSRCRGIVTQATGVSNVELPWAGTFHSVAARLLRIYGPKTGLRRDFTIKDKSDSADLLDMVRHDLGYSDPKNSFPKKDVCLAIYSFVVNSQTKLLNVLETRFPEQINFLSQLKKLFAGYDCKKREQNVLDYDDLLAFWLALLQHPSSAKAVRALFDYVLVDEYQDTNRLQSKILLLLKPDGRGLTVVGDDAQSIYSFRAATVRNILDFPNSVLPKARVVKLERNYRSTQHILAACNAVIAPASERFSKTLWSKRKSKSKPIIVRVRNDLEQARFIVDKIIECRENGVPLGEQAALFRSSHHSAELELELIRRGIPFKKYGGQKFLEAAHIKDVISILSWCENPKDVIAGFRCLQLVQGVGPTLATKILAELAGKNSKERLAVLAIPNAALPSWQKFCVLLNRIRAQDTWRGQVSRVRRWYKPLLSYLSGDAGARLADLDQLERIAAKYETRRQFLTDLTLDPPDSTTNAGKLEDRDSTILSTIHSAKGREWQAVRILNVVDGCIPSSRAKGSKEIDEERRLLFVAMTRARNELELIVPQQTFYQNRNGYGSHHLMLKRSQFIPRSISARFRHVRYRRNWPVARCGERHS